MLLKARGAKECFPARKRWVRLRPTREPRRGERSNAIGLTPLLGLTLFSRNPSAYALGYILLRLRRFGQHALAPGASRMSPLRGSILMRCALIWAPIYMTQIDGDDELGSASRCIEFVVAGFMPASVEFESNHTFPYLRIAAIRISSYSHCSVLKAVS